jgi:hypothetical protein
MAQSLAEPPDVLHLWAGDGLALSRTGRTPSSAFVVAEFEGIRLPDHPVILRRRSSADARLWSTTRTGSSREPTMCRQFDAHHQSSDLKNSINAGAITAGCTSWVWPGRV